jgi:hypothetical protein
VEPSTTSNDASEIKFDALIGPKEDGPFVISYLMSTPIPGNRGSWGTEEHENRLPQKIQLPAVDLSTSARIFQVSRTRVYTRIR